MNKESNGRPRRVQLPENAPVPLRESVSHVKTAVDANELARHVGRLVGGECHHPESDLLGKSNSAHRNFGEHRLFLLIVEDCSNVGVDEAGGDGVYRNRTRRVLSGKRSGQALEA